jgi:hypothetical protein
MTATHTVHRRGFSASVLAIVAIVAAMMALAGDNDARAEGHTHGAAALGAPPRALNAQLLVFHDQMRKLWEDHVTWTRLAIVTFADGSAGFPATAARLLQNQADIGDAIKPYFGTAAGDQLTALLHDHITIAVELLPAAKAGDSAAFADASTRWYANADDIADFLAAANRRFWPQAAMRAAMKEHLDQTLAEAQHELAGDYPASVADYELIHAHILEMADTLSNGIMRAFPQLFH